MPNLFSSKPQFAIARLPKENKIIITITIIITTEDNNNNIINNKTTKSISTQCHTPLLVHSLREWEDGVDECPPVAGGAHTHTAQRQQRPGGHTAGGR